MKTELGTKAAEQITRAVDHLKAGYSCAEAVLVSYGPGLGVDPETAGKIAGGFGGGMGQGETCGAVAAAYMVIGLKYGAGCPEDRAARALTYDLVAEFSDRFKQRNRSTLCRELTGGINMGDAEGKRQIRESGKVIRIVSDAVMILDVIFREN